MVSIIVPCYNGQKFITRCFNSILNQSYKQIEVILVNDGSTDKSEEIISEYKNKFIEQGMKFNYIYKENGGMHTAHNVAYENIYTELNMCIDSDDYLVDNAIERITEFWNQKKDEKYGGIIALDIHKDGSNVGTFLPNQK